MVSLLSLMAAVKAVIIALNAQHYAEAATRLASRYRAEIVIDKSEVVILAAALLLAIAGLSVMLARWRQAIVLGLQDRLLSLEGVQLEQGRLADDHYWINSIAPQVDSLVKVVEVLFFVGLIGAMIAFISVQVLWILIVSILLVALAILLAQRQRLRAYAELQRAQAAHQHAIARANSDVDVRRRWADSLRPEYIRAHRKFRSFHLNAQQAGHFVVALCIAGLVVYLPTHQMIGSDLALAPLPVIFIIIALRQSLHYAIELGQLVSGLLELRSRLNVLTSHMKAASSTD